MPSKCEGRKPTGKHCAFNAIEGHRFCGIHLTAMKTFNEKAMACAYDWYNPETGEITRIMFVNNSPLLVHNSVLLSFVHIDVPWQVKAFDLAMVLAEGHKLTFKPCTSPPVELRSAPIG